MYQMLYTDTYGGGVVNHYKSEFEGKGYLYKGAEINEIEDRKEVGRFDAIILAYKYLSSDLKNILFGLGIRNAFISSFNASTIRGVDARLLGGNRIVISSLMWELGLLGVIFYILFYFFIFSDALYLRSKDDLFGDFALGWCSVLGVLCICLVYKNYIKFDSINYLFWYFSGIIAAKAKKQKKLQSNPNTSIN
jgi:hypothetical protein